MKKEKNVCRLPLNLLIHFGYSYSIAFFFPFYCILDGQPNDECTIVLLIKRRTSNQFITNLYEKTKLRIQNILRKTKQNGYRVKVFVI